MRQSNIAIPASADDAPALIKFRDTGSDAFTRTLRKRVNAYLRDQGGNRLADWRILFKLFLYGMFAALCYAALMSGAYGAWSSLALAIGYGVCVLLVGVNIGHDGAHGVLTGRQAVDRFLQIVSFAFIGVDGYLWRMRHNGSHHVFPNVNGCDADIDQNPFLRLSPNHPRRSYQRFQHLYAPVVYFLVSLHSIFFQDFQYLAKRHLANMHYIRHPLWAWCSFCLAKIVYFTMSLLLPLLLLPFAWWQIVIGFVVVNGIMSIIFVFLLIGTHFAEQAEFPALDAEGHLPGNATLHAFSTSVDWNPDSRLANFISGGANAHVAHHLFPRISHIHYIPVTRIIRETAAEFGVRHNVTSFPGLVASHFAFLRRMARA
jgi:linoleoyl-CoA desaturase